MHAVIAWEPSSSEGLQGQKCLSSRDELKGTELKTCNCSDLP